MGKSGLSLKLQLKTIPETYHTLRPLRPLNQPDNHRLHLVREPPLPQLPYAINARSVVSVALTGGYYGSSVSNMTYMAILVTSPIQLQHASSVLGPHCATLFAVRTLS